MKVLNEIKDLINTQDEVLSKDDSLKLAVSVTLLADATIQVNSKKPGQMICGIATQALLAADKPTLASISNGVGQVLRMRDKGFLRVTAEYIGTCIVGASTYALK